jgi:hypothetical protein
MKFKSTILCLFLFFVSYAQKRSYDNKGFAIIPNIGLSTHLPGGDMKARYGTSTAFHISTESMTDRGNWILGGEFGYFFGRKVKENPLKGLYNVDELIFGGDFQPTNVFLRERGLWAGGYFGKLIPISMDNQRSGIRVTIGLGHLRHRIRIQDDTKTVVQIDKPYSQGYDRLTGGLYLSQFIGYQHLSKNRRINTTIGFDLMQGFTKSMRDWDWDKKSKDTTRRLDLLSGMRLMWSLPFYIGEKAEDIYY